MLYQNYFLVDQKRILKISVKRYRVDFFYIINIFIILKRKNKKKYSSCQYLIVTFSQEPVAFQPTLYAVYCFCPYGGTVKLKELNICLPINFPKSVKEKIR